MKALIHTPGLIHIKG